MIVTITNLSATKCLSTDIGLLQPSETRSKVVSPEEAYKMATTMQGLIDRGYITLSTDQDPAALDDLETAILSKKITQHTEVLAAGSFESAPAKSPDPIQFGTVLALEFTLNIDDAHVIRKVPQNYAGNPMVHVHWTKAGNGNELNKNVKWVISYLIYNGNSEIALASPQTIELEDTYTDSGTTTRITHRTDNGTLSGVAAGQYVSFQIEAVTPVGTPMASKPVLISLDFAYDVFIN